MRRDPKELLQDESGATSIEYGLLLLIMAIGIIASVQALPASLLPIFNSVGSNLN